VNLVDANSGKPNRRCLNQAGTGNASLPAEALDYAKVLSKLGAGEFFPPTPTTNLSNLLIEASIYCYLYALNEELKDYPKLLSDFRKTWFW
jgi:hypothetical protein